MFCRETCEEWQNMPIQHKSSTEFWLFLVCGCLNLWMEIPWIWRANCTFCKLWSNGIMNPLLRRSHMPSECIVVTHWEEYVKERKLLRSVANSSVLDEGRGGHQDSRESDATVDKCKRAYWQYSLLAVTGRMRHSIRMAGDLESDCLVFMSTLKSCTYRTH